MQAAVLRADGSAMMFSAGSPGAARLTSSTWLPAVTTKSRPAAHPLRRSILGAAPAAAAPALAAAGRRRQRAGHPPRQAAPPPGQARGELLGASAGGLLQRF